MAYVYRTLHESRKRSHLGDEHETYKHAPIRLTFRPLPVWTSPPIPIMLRARNYYRVLKPLESPRLALFTVSASTPLEARSRETRSSPSVSRWWSPRPVAWPVFHFKIYTPFNYLSQYRKFADIEVTRELNQIEDLLEPTQVTYCLTQLHSNL